MGPGIKNDEPHFSAMSRTCARKLVCSVAVLLAACSTKPAGPAFDPKLARNLDEMATTAAAAKTGAKVCRQTEIGIAERDWLRGVVTEVARDMIVVRIEQAGRFPQSLNGTPLARGAIVRDSAAAWTPCRF
jgi:hypothetical protein